ncbi:MAG: DUF1735 domain-containing protein [Bacteroidales bacterium]|nr:DUF1735 domain-containing protein [Bacteroidales bacterium]
MKKLILFLLITALLNSCYDEYRLDYEYSSVAFSYVTGGSNEPGVLWRSVVKDEGLQLDVGIYLSGILENTKERWADFEIDATLLDGTPYTLMPESYYSLSNTGRFVIPSGEYIGRVTVTLDSMQFMNDELTTTHHYAIPFRLTETSEDSILATQSTQIVVVKYINHYEGFYIHSGSFVTKSNSGEELNAGSIDNVLRLSTVRHDSVETNGSMHLIGDDYHMKLLVREDNSVWFAYNPNLASITDPVNLGPDATASTSYVSSWETLEAIQDGDEPENSGPGKGTSGQAFGNWYQEPKTYNWVQYDLPSLYYINKSDVYWWTDWDRDDATLPWGGIDIPFNTHIEYWDIENEEWVMIPNPVVNNAAVDAGSYGPDTLNYDWTNRNVGCEIDQWNITTFDAVLTNKVRLWFVAVGSQGILEWRVWGVPGAAGLEMTQIESITPNGTNVFDPETSTFTLNYKVNYKYGDYSTDVSATMTWRNRIRDGVNEWRR